jgi:hypothetical protein
VPPPTSQTAGTLNDICAEQLYKWLTNENKLCNIIFAQDYSTQTPSMAYEIIYRFGLDKNYGINIP